MQMRFVIALIVIDAFFGAQAADAQDIMLGQQIARTWCSGCHNVGSQEQKSGSDAVPSFSSIARMPSTTEMSLAAFLSTSHGRMPDYALSRAEIQNVSAYILSLRKSR